MSSTKSWVQVQRLAFTRWANTHLTQRDLLVEDLEEDFKDGILLIELLEQLSGDTLPKYNKRPKLRIQRLENINLGLEYLKDKGVKLVNVGAEDIENGNVKLILGLVWSVVTKYQIDAIVEDDSKEELEILDEDPFAPGFADVPRSSAKDTAASKLLRFVNQQLANYELATVTNFTSDFQDGSVLIALTDSLRPGCLDMGELFDPITNAELAISTAEGMFSIPRIIDAVDVVQNPQAHAMMTYISLFQKCLADKALRKETEHKQPDMALVQQQAFEEEQRLKDEKRKEDERRRREEEERVRQLQIARQMEIERIQTEEAVRRAREAERRAREEAERQRWLEEQSKRADEEERRRAEEAEQQRRAELERQWREEEDRRKEEERRRAEEMRRREEEEARRAADQERRRREEEKQEDYVEPNAELNLLIDQELFRDHQLAEIYGFRMAPIDKTKRRHRLTVGCSSLLKMQKLGKSSPTVGVFERNEQTGEFLLIDQTEWIDDEHDPVFRKPLVVYLDEVKDRTKAFRFKVWDVSEQKKKIKADRKKLHVGDDNLIGYVDVTLIDVINNPGISKHFLQHPGRRQAKKLDDKRSRINLSINSYGLRQARIQGFKPSESKIGDKLDMRISVNDLNHRSESFADRFRDGFNPMVAVFDRKTNADGSHVLSLIGQTEWTHHAKKRETFATHIALYFNRNQLNSRWLRLCVYHVKNPGKGVLRSETAAPISVDIGETDMLGFRDMTLKEVVDALEKKDGALTYPLFGAEARGGQGSFTIRGGVEKEVARVQFVNVLDRQNHEYIGHEVQISMRGENFYKLDMTTASDPVVGFFCKEEKTGDFVMTGQTEWIKHSTNPKFEEKFMVYSDLVEDHEFRINVYDINIDEWEKIRGVNKQPYPVIQAADGALTNEPTLLGVAKVRLQQLLVASALGEEVKVPLFYPAAIASNQALGADQSKTQVANHWYKTKCLDDKKSSIIVSAKVHHAVLQAPSHRHYHNKHLETPPVGCEVHISDVPVKRIAMAGHEVVLSLAASNLLKMDWHSRSDPMVAIFEMVPKPQEVVPHQKGGWECTICTFVNDMDFLICDMCGQQKSPGAREISPTPQSAAPKVVELTPLLIAQTEWQSNNDKPEFDKKISLFFDPDCDLRLRFAVYDVDSVNVTHSDIIGWTDINLSELVANDGNKLDMQLSHNDSKYQESLNAKQSTLHISPTLQFAAAEKGKRTSSMRPGSQVSFDCLNGPVSNRGRGSSFQKRETMLEVTVGVQNLLKMDWLSKSTPVVAIFEQSPSGHFDKLLGQTEWIADTHDVVFNSKITIQCTVNPSDCIRICVFHVDSPAIREEDMMGYVDITRGELNDASIVETPQAVDLDDFFSMAPMVARSAPLPALDNAKAWHKTLQLTNPHKESWDQMLKSKGTTIFLRVVSKPAPQVNILGWGK